MAFKEWHELVVIDGATLGVFNSTGICAQTGVFSMVACTQSLCK